MTGIIEDRQRPILRYREDCSAVKHWALRVQSQCGHAFDIVAETDRSLPYVLRLELPDGRLFQDLAAVTRVKSEFIDRTFLLRLQFHLPSFFRLADWLMRHLAIRHANFLIKPLRSASEYAPASRFFIRAMGLIYFIAFLTTLPQILGLVGSHGMLPLAQFPIFGFTGANADRALLALCVLGSLLSVALVVRIKPFVCSLSLYLLYQLLVTAGGEFFAFTFDHYVLEVGLIAVLVAPFTGKRGRFSAPPRILIWYIWWLLLRIVLFPLLNFFSGPTVDFAPSQARYDLMCQPLPTPVSWWIFQAPLWLQITLTTVTLLVSAIALIGLLGGRRLRPYAGFAIIALTLWGALQGNGAYGFWLTLALCAFCFDESWFQRLRFKSAVSEPLPASGTHSLFRPLVVGSAASFLWLLSLIYTAEGYGSALPASAESLLRWATPYRIMLSHIGYARPVYNRPEIIIEGTVDGKHWKPYWFNWKPGLVTEAPRFAWIYHPRLDWHLWFPFTGNSSYWIGALLYNTPNQLGHTYEWKPEPALLNFIEGLKKNQPEIIALLPSNPFSKQPPSQIRILLYDYQFSRMKEKKKTGRWWSRKLLGRLDLEKEQLYPEPPPVKVAPPKTPASPQLPKKADLPPTFTISPKATTPTPPLTATPSALPATVTLTLSVNQTPVGGKGPVDNKTGSH